MTLRTFTAADGLALAYRDSAPDHPKAAHAVLCLPGLSRNSLDFAALARRVGGRHRVIAVDYRGRGESARDPTTASYRPEVYVDDIRHALVVAGVARCVVVGTSLGGLLGLGLCVACPSLVAGLVMNDIGPHVPRGGLDQVLGHIAAPPSPADWAEAVSTLRTLLPDLSLRGDPEWLEFAHATFREGPGGALEARWDPAILRHLPKEPPDLWPLFRATGDRPLLVVRGGASAVLTARTLWHMKEARPDLRAVELPGVGHAPSLAEPETWEEMDVVLGALG